MIAAQQEHKSRWRGRYWRRVELELVDGGAVKLDGGSPKAPVRISDEGSDLVRVEIADVAAYEAARRACVLPRCEKLRLRGAGLFAALDAHHEAASKSVLAAAREKRESERRNERKLAAFAEEAAATRLANSGLSFLYRTKPARTDAE